MGFYFLDDPNNWGGADLNAIICYLIFVALVFAYFLADDEPESASPAVAPQRLQFNCRGTAPVLGD